MKKFLAVLPLFLLFVVTSCSEAETPTEEPKVEEKKPLVEREPEVREYLDVVDELVGEYLTLGETFMDNMDKANAGDLSTIEKMQVLLGMSDTALKISELSAELELVDTSKSDLEKKLDADDVIEFGMILTEKMQRFNDLAKRIEEADYEKAVSELSLY